MRCKLIVQVYTFNVEYISGRHNDVAHHKNTIVARAYKRMLRHLKKLMFDQQINDENESVQENHPKKPKTVPETRNKSRIMYLARTSMPSYNKL